MVPVSIVDSTGCREPTSLAVFAGAWTSAGRVVKSAVTGTGQAVTGAVFETGRRIASAGAAVRERMRGEPEGGSGEVEPV